VKFWKRSVSSLNYGGGFFFNEAGTYQQVSVTQQFAAAQRFLGRTRQLTIVDSFGNSNAGGSFGSSVFGGSALFSQIFADTGVGGGGAGTPGLALFAGGDVFGETGIGYQVNNVVEGVFTQTLKNRTALSAVGAFGINTYLGNSQGLSSSRAYTAAVQLSHQINWRSSVGVLFGHKIYDYPFYQQNSASALQVRSLTSNVVQISYRRVLSRRLSLGGGAGPSFDSLTSELSYLVPGSTTPSQFVSTTLQVSLSAYGALSYALKNGAVSVSYDKATTSGSGLYEGANTDLATLGWSQSLSKNWGTGISAGYGRLKQIPTSFSLPGSPLYQSWYVGASATRNIGREIGLFISYQFGDESTGNAVCLLNQCVARQTIASVGISWHGRPIRLDGDNPLRRGNGRSDVGDGSVGNPANP
jgi:hypothetical protein